MTDHYALITFESTHTAIATEQRLVAEGLRVRLIPVPTQITAGCGLALRFDREKLSVIRAQCPEFPDTAFYEVFRNGREKKVIPLI